MIFFTLMKTSVYGDFDNKTLDDDFIASLDALNQAVLEEYDRENAPLPLKIESLIDAVAYMHGSIARQTTFEPFSIGLPIINGIILLTSVRLQ